VTVSVWDTIAREAAEESPLWAAALRPLEERAADPVFSSLGEPRFALAVETIYEGYLLHYGRPRLFRPPDADTAVLLGDYLYAHGLVRLAEHGDVDAVANLAELISLCTQLRAEDGVGAAPLDGLAWAATAAHLASGDPALGRARSALRIDRDPTPLANLAAATAGADALAAALAAHAVFVE
jgi:hypothetical protein